MLKIVFLVIVCIYIILLIKNYMGNTVYDMDGIQYKITGQTYLFDIISLYFICGKFWEIHMQKYYKTVSSRKPGIILDIGANIGSHTTFFANQRNVWSFEPQKNTFNILAKNIKQNKLKFDVTLFNIGLSSKNTILQMDKKTFYNNGASKIGGGGENIRVKKLDDIWIEGGRPQISFIKIDVEDHEVDVFKGADELLKSQNPIIFYEDRINGSNGKNTEYLEELGYNIKKIFGEDYIAYKNNDINIINLLI